MNLDSILIASFIYVFFITNLFGWGWLHNSYFFVFSVFVSLIYIVMDVFIKSKNIFFLKSFLIVLFLGVAIFGVTTQIIVMRNNTSEIQYVSDSTLQTEIAGRFILLGLNPYTKDYDNTALMRWDYEDPAGRTINPAVYHNVIPPFNLLLSAGGFRLFSQLFGFFDFRVFILGAFFSVVVLGFLKFRKGALLLFLAFVCMNPYFNTNMIRGTNDILIVAFLLWSLFFLEKKYIVISAVLLGLSLATKQSAWFAAPFYFLYASQLLGKKVFGTYVIVAVLAAFVIYLPFFATDFQRTFTSLIFYPTKESQNESTTHPIEGFGFSQFVYSSGMVKSIYESYPFWAYQGFFGGITLISLLVKLRKKISSSQVIFSATILTAIVWFFNRYFLESHIAYIVVMLGAGFVWKLSEDIRQKQSLFKDYF